MLLLILAIFFYWPLPFSVGPQKNRMGQGPARLVCDQLPSSPGRMLIPSSPGCWCREVPSVSPIRKGISPWCKAWRVDFLQPCMWDGDHMLRVWVWHFCLWTHDLVAVGLEQIVGYDLGWVPWPSPGNGLVPSAIVGRRVTHMNSANTSSCPLSSLCDTTLGGNLAKMLKGQSCPNTIWKASAVRGLVWMSSWVSSHNGKGLGDVLNSQAQSWGWVQLFHLKLPLCEKCKFGDNNFEH